MINTSFNIDNKETNQTKTNEGIQELLNMYEIKETFQDLLMIELEKKMDEKAKYKSTKLNMNKNNDILITEIETQLDNNDDDKIDLDLLSILDNNSKGIKFSKILGNDETNKKIANRIDELQETINNNVSNKNVIDTSKLNEREMKQLERSLGMRC